MNPPSPAKPDRYQDRPFLLLIDCYVLDAIGQLAPQQRAALEQLEPRLQESFGTAAPWRGIVEEQMSFLPTVSLQIEMAWAAYQALENGAGRESVPGYFVREFVAQNFPDLVDDGAPTSPRPPAPAGKPRRTRKR